MNNKDIMNFYANMEKELAKFNGDRDSLTDAELQEIKARTHKDEKQLLYSLMTGKQNLVLKIQELETKYNSLLQAYRHQEEVIERYRAELRVNNRPRQVNEVREGKPLNEKMSAFDYKHLHEQGYTDDMIMEKFGVSRSTIWRKKNELKQRELRIQQRLDSQRKQNPNNNMGW